MRATRQRNLNTDEMSIKVPSKADLRYGKKTKISFQRELKYLEKNLHVSNV
jgi:hypothetical protein